MDAAKASELAQEHGEWAGTSMELLLGAVSEVTAVSDDGLGSVTVLGKLWNPAAVRHASPQEAAAWAATPAAQGVAAAAAAAAAAAGGSAALFGGLAVGDVVRIRDVAPDEARRVHGNLGFLGDEMGPMLGTRCTVTATVKEGNLEAVRCQGKNWAPAMLEKLGSGAEGHRFRRLQVGDEVMLSSSEGLESVLKYHAATKGGALRPGGVGRLVEDQEDDRPFKVQAGTVISW
jgi:hypothetical protein